MVHFSAWEHRTLPSGRRIYQCLAILWVKRKEGRGSEDGIYHKRQGA